MTNAEVISSDAWFLVITIAHKYLFLWWKTVEINFKVYVIKEYA